MSNLPDSPEVQDAQARPVGDPATGSRRRRNRLVLAVTLAVVVVAAAVVVPLLTLNKGSFASAITVSDGACAPSWRPTTSGRHVYQVTNTGSTPEEVSIIGSDRKTTYAEVDMIAPGTRVPLVAILPPGTYSWSCEGDDGVIGYSNPGKVTGPPVANADPWIPVDYDQLAGAVELYRTSVTTGLNQLATDTDKLLAAIEAGGVTGAQLAIDEQLWLVAHLDYSRLGAAYGTFGGFADKIDGRADGLPGGVDDPKFTGFLRVEYALWHGQSRAEVLAQTQTLDDDVHGLIKAFPSQQTAPTDIALRTHEILENALQFELTGDTDEGSHTNLATVAANIQGTQMTFAAITPLLQEVAPELIAPLTNVLKQLAALVATYQRPDGTWTPVEHLPGPSREKLDGAISGAVEQLSVVPDRLDIVLTHDNQN